MRALVFVSLLLASLAGAMPEAGASGPQSDDARIRCGGRAEARLAEAQVEARRLTLERDLAEGALTHCGYFLRRACLEWETTDPSAGRHAFELAHRFCDDPTVAARGLVAARLVHEDYPGAYAAYRERMREGDSLAVAPYAAAVFGGLSLTEFGVPDDAKAFRLPDPPLDPDRAYRLSILPGAGFLYAGEMRLAVQHFLLSAGLGALTAWRIHEGYTGADRDARRIAWLDAGVVGLLWKRYHVGGMREARRKAKERNRRVGAERVRAAWVSLDPFRP